jgi:hypothetical protein
MTLRVPSTAGTLARGPDQVELPDKPRLRKGDARGWAAEG